MGSGDQHVRQRGLLRNGRPEFGKPLRRLGPGRHGRGSARHRESRGVQYGPGIGFAYALNSKTVIRTGGRIAYDRMQGNPWYSCLGVPPTTRAGTLYYGNLTTLTITDDTFSAPGNN